MLNRTVTHQAVSSRSARRLVALAAVVTVSGLISNTEAATFTYNESTPTTTQWAAGTSWDATPVSAADTILNLNGTLAAGDALISNNDISGNFLLNQLNFSYVGPASGTAPTVTITGNPLEFSNASARIMYSTSNVSGTTAASRPRLIINNDIILSTALSVQATSEGPRPDIILNGAITGSNSLTFNRASGSATTYAISNTGNDYTGDTRMTLGTTTGRDFTLRLDNSEVIPNGVGRGNFFQSATSEAGTIYLQLNGNNETVNGLSSTVPGQAGSAGVHRVRNVSANTATFTFGDNDTTASYVGTIENGTGAGLLNLVKIGTGSQTLSGVSTHTGITTVTDGTLKIDYAVFGTSLTSTPNNYFSSVSGLTLDGGTTFAIDGRRNGAATSQAGVSMGNAARSISLPNAIASQLVVGQKLFLTKTDAGTGVFTAGDAYITAFGTPGATHTTVFGNKRMVATAGLTATVDTVATIASTTQTLKSLTLSGSVGETATLDFGTSDNVILTVNAAPVQVNDGSLLAIANWNGTLTTGGGTEQLLFTGEPTDFTSVFSQSEVSFTGYGTGYSIIDNVGNYEVIPVPEPMALAVLALGGLGLLARNRRRA